MNPHESTDENLNCGLVFRRFGPPLEVLTLESYPLQPLHGEHVRVRMLAAPVNPSDLIPVTGALRHRVKRPRTCGYEGVGVVVEGSAGFEHLVGVNVLPLKSTGTWQRFVDCHVAWTIVVPAEIDVLLACRSFINPLSAYLMLKGRSLGNAFC